MVVLIGLVIVGLVIIGFSVSAFFQAAAERARRLAERRRVDVNAMPWGEDPAVAPARSGSPAPVEMPSRGGAAARQDTLFDEDGTAETTFLGTRETTVLPSRFDDEPGEDPFVDVSDQLAAERAKTTLIPVPERRGAQEAESPAEDLETPPFDVPSADDIAALDADDGEEDGPDRTTADRTTADHASSAAPAIPRLPRSPAEALPTSRHARLRRGGRRRRRREGGELQLPPLSMLRHNPHSASSASSEKELEQTAHSLQSTP